MKFVVSHRRAGKFQKTEKVASRSAMNAAMSSLPSSMQIIEDKAPSDDLARRTVIMEGAEAEMHRMAAETPDDVIVEPLIMHAFDKTTLGTFSAVNVVPQTSPLMSGGTNQVTIRARGRGRPLRGATVILVVRPMFGEPFAGEGETGANGEVTFQLSPFLQPLFTIVIPYGEFWSARSALTGRTTTVVCRRLPSNQRIDWWHRAVGFPTFQKTAGRKINVGVIDTGFGPHPHLTGVNEGAFIDNQFLPGAAGEDVDVHGSHVSGTIAGNPGRNLRHSGVAPGVNLFSVRVFPEGQGAANVDIANAIDFLSRERECDLINMSLGAPVPSAIIQDAMQDALERGTLCICAAGNSDGPVEWPAAFPEGVAVAAAGRIGEAPPESVSATKEPQDINLFGLDQMYFANFSCFGPEIDCISPGVGIIAPVPDRHGLTAAYAALDGTSMASPIACGTLARALSKSRAYRAMPRDQTRAGMARATLAQICRSIAIPEVNEGDGMPFD